MIKCTLSAFFVIPNSGLHDFDDDMAMKSLQMLIIMHSITLHAVRSWFPFMENYLAKSAASFRPQSHSRSFQRV